MAAFPPDLRNPVLVDCQGGMTYAANVAEAIRAAGGEVVSRPPYGPDRNPIEKVFSKAPGEVRNRKPRAVAETAQLCGKGLDWFTTEQCENYIRHAGYGPQRSA